MKSPVRFPRLLPLTIGMLSVVLVTKSVLLVRAMLLHGQSTTLIQAAWAGGHGEKQEAKPAKAEHKAPPKAAAEPPKADDRPPVPEGPPPVSESEKALLLELRARRQELEARETTLSNRESMLSAAENKVAGRVEELQGLQKKLESLDATRRQQEDNVWQGLVKVYETMKPRDAAAIFNDLAMPVLVSVMDRMKETKAAAVLSAMAAEKAREVTIQLALSRTRAAGGLDSAGKSPASPGSAPPLLAKPPASGT